MDKAVSPVLGVVLMVGIAVLLVAVVGGAISEIGGDVEGVVAAEVQVDQLDQEVRLEELQGDATGLYFSGDVSNGSTKNPEINKVGETWSFSFAETGDDISVVATDGEEKTTTIRTFTVR